MNHQAETTPGPTVLMANRGVIAGRILRTVRRLGWRAVAVYSEADAATPAVREADEKVLLGPPPASASYLDAAAILRAARRTGATIVHPGYGFLSENADFAEACAAEGVAFAGPTPEQIRRFGLKNTARDVARECGVPLLPGTGLLETVAEAEAAAETIGYPVMLKSTAGGGGIGMRVCHHAAELREAYESVRRLGEANFRHGGVFLEKFIAAARHVEVQIFGDGLGRVWALGERDCSVQRRNQKVIEETPAPGLAEHVRRELHDCAVRLGEAVQYQSAGTVEFLYDAAAEKFYFLEVNTRLQVEHGVTEEVFGVDLVEWMLRLAAGERGFLPGGEAQPEPHGASVQARIYAEMPFRNFQPSTGLVTRAAFPSGEGIRVETWLEDGAEVTGFYDPMLAKIIATAPTREEAVTKLGGALRELEIHGIETNQDFLQAVLQSCGFAEGGVTTGFLAAFPFEPQVVEVVEGGIETLVVDAPGRVGYWDVGVPPSGPFDERSFRLANQLLGNEEGAAGLEFTLRGPSLRFLAPAWICLTGADFTAQLDGEPVPTGKVLEVRGGAVLEVPHAQGPGLRGYLAVRGGWQVPKYLGSRTTFRLGMFGGHGGRALRTGDVLRLPHEVSPPPGERSVEAEAWSHHWDIAVSYGPHGAPDFFTEEDIRQFFATEWEVHYNSARTGVRLIGPKPQWARPDGGEAGLHPSNIHDNAYQVGAIDFTGDMPIILGPDGPSLGGFVCPATVLGFDFWKVGQLRPGDKVRFHPVALEEAVREPDAARNDLLAVLEDPIFAGPPEAPVPVVYRRQGDSGVLVEYGEQILDLPLRFRVQALYEALQARAVPGLWELTPGIRSLQVRYDQTRIGLEAVLDLLRNLERELPPAESMTVPTRIVHLPLSWDDPATQLAVEKYAQSVRPDAPWCPSNLEFIRRINGLSSLEEVKEIVYAASYLVMGLGDVYLGAPVATPLDPRHRLVTTKYNPARTWTPENAVGIGGAYMCIYGMEGPGGYQLVGRTVPVWNRFRTTRSFRPGHPWLLRFFDQIRFYPVEKDELLSLREQILTGEYEPRIEEAEFRLADYLRFLEAEAEGIAAFRARQRQAFAEERERWVAAGQLEEKWEVEPAVAATEEVIIPPGCRAVSSPAAGNLWKVLVAPGQKVEEGETVAILESMKMEIPCVAPTAGVVETVLAREGRPASPGQPLVVLRD
jgi:urea carboxylase